METEDDTNLRALEDQEKQTPSLPVISKINGATSIIYASKPTMLELSGHPILTDFGQMRLVEGSVSGDWCMPDLYRAPEVMLQLPWGFPVDIWAIGVMVGGGNRCSFHSTNVLISFCAQTLELLEGKNLFDPIDRAHGHYVLPLALAQYIGYLGPPPLHIIRQSPIFTTYFDEQGKHRLTFQFLDARSGLKVYLSMAGNWISEPPIPKTSLEDFVTIIPPGEEKDQFLRFVRKMLTWDPEARATSNDIIPDEWLMRPVEEMM